jgi:hypothetical protein
VRPNAVDGVLSLDEAGNICGIIGAFARPNWRERPTAESLTGGQWRDRIQLA